MSGDVFSRSFLQWCSRGGELSSDEQHALLMWMWQLLGGPQSALLDQLPPTRVSLEEFGRVAHLFPLRDGPLSLCRLCQRLARASWWWGRCSLSSAHDALLRMPKGSFLVRMGRGAHAGSVSVSRVTDPMCVLHSRLYWNDPLQQWALKTRPSQHDSLDDMVNMTSSSSSSSSSMLLSPRVLAGDARSMMQAVRRRTALREAAQEEAEKRGKQQHDDDDERNDDDDDNNGGGDGKRLDGGVRRSELRAYLDRLKRHDNALGVAPGSPVPLLEWVTKHQKVLDLRVACPGSPFAQVLSSSATKK